MNEKQSLLDEDTATSDDDVNVKKKESSVSFRQLFRHADQTDCFVLFFGVCASMLQGISIALYFFLLGRLTGAFIVQSFVNHCHNEEQKPPAAHHNLCPLGINVNSMKSLYWNKFCGNGNSTLSSPLPITVDFRMKIMTYIHWLLIISILQLISTSSRHFLFELAAKRQTIRIRVRLFQGLLQKNISYFDEHPIGQLNSKLFDNIDKINMTIGFEFSTIITLIFSIIVVIIIGLYINWKLTLIMICLIPFVVVTMRLFSQFKNNEATKAFMAHSKANQIVHEVFSSLRTVLSLNGARFEQRRYAKELEGSHWNSVRTGMALGLLIGWFYFIAYIMYGSGFIFGLLLMHYEGDDQSMISDILVIVISFSQCISLLGLIGPFLQKCAEAQTAAIPVFRLIDETEGPDAIQTEKWAYNNEEDGRVDLTGDVRFDNVTFIYPSRQDLAALRNLTLVARTGETTALVGVSGSGKSTCMSLLLRYYEPLSGRITFGGRSLSDYNVRELRKSIGIVSQEPSLFGTSIYENIRYGRRNASREEIEEAAKQANAHNFIMQLPNKYETLVGESDAQLSGGEKQRIALARALVKKPTLLLMDEATSALDTSGEKIVQGTLDRTCNGRTTIIIAHRLSTIRNAHRIYVFENGAIVEQGTHDTLMCQEGSKYRDMIKAQMIDEINCDNSGQDLNRASTNDKDNEQQTSKNTLLHQKDQVTIEDQKTSSEGQSTFLRLLAMNRPEWRIMLIGYLICVAVGATQPLFAILLFRIVDAFGSCTYEERRYQVLIFSFLFLLLGLLSVVLRFFQFSAFASSGSLLTKSIRLKAFESLLRQEVGFFDRSENTPGAILTRLSSDAIAVEQMVGTRLGIIFETAAMLSFGVIVAYIFNWKLASVFLVFLILLLVLISLEVYLQQRVNKYDHLILTQSGSLVVEAIRNIRVVKQFVLEKEFLRRYVDFIHELYRIRRTYSAIISIISGIYWSAIPFQVAAIYSLSFGLAEQKKLELDDVIKVFAFASFFSQSARIMTSLSKEIGDSTSGAQSFFNLFDRTPAIDNGSTKGKEIIDFRGEIEFNLIKFAYPTRPTSNIFDKFRLNIKSGQRIAVVGTSGSGKSTLVQLLERFYDVTEGQLLLDSIDIRRLNLHWLRSRLGLVSQEPVLFDLTINENIAYGLDGISQEDIIDAAIKANIHAFIRTLPQGYETRVGPKGNQLSGGEKQRIAIARVLIRQPKILLLDEATSAMDSYNQQIVQKALDRAQMEDPMRTTITIAHRLSTIVSCDRIFVLNKGYLAESGTHTELIQRRGLYYQMLADNI